MERCHPGFRRPADYQPCEGSPDIVLLPYGRRICDAHHERPPSAVMPTWALVTPLVVVLADRRQRDRSAHPSPVSVPGISRLPGRGLCWFPETPGPVGGKRPYASSFRACYQEARRHRLGSGAGLVIFYHGKFPTRFGRERCHQSRSETAPGQGFSVDTIGRSPMITKDAGEPRVSPNLSEAIRHDRRVLPDDHRVPPPA
jgi:hypothetical protein